MSGSRPSMGVFTKVPVRGICFPLRSAVVLTCSHSGHAADCMHLQKPLNPGFVCVLITAVFGHTVVFIALLATNHFATAAPSQTLFVWVLNIMHTRENQPNMKKRGPWKHLFKDALLKFYVEFKRQIEFHSQILWPDISIASFLQIYQVTQSYCSLEDLYVVINS